MVWKKTHKDLVLGILRMGVPQQENMSNVQCVKVTAQEEKKAEMESKMLTPPYWKQNSKTFVSQSQQILRCQVCKW